MTGIEPVSSWRRRKLNAVGRNATLAAGEINHHDPDYAKHYSAVAVAKRLRGLIAAASAVSAKPA